MSTKFSSRVMQALREQPRLKFTAQRMQFVVSAVLLMFAFSLCFVSPAFAATGEGVFEQAATNILCNVLHAEFGAMLTAIAGVLAIVAAAVGSFKGAWALLFVSVGSFIADSLVGLLFDGITC